MKINWIIRFKNPVFWLNLAITIIFPVLAYMYLYRGDIISLAGFGSTLLKAITNPIIIIGFVIGVRNLINDPTTYHVYDSDRVLGYTEPGK